MVSLFANSIYNWKSLVATKKSTVTFIITRVEWSQNIFQSLPSHLSQYNQQKVNITRNFQIITRFAEEGPLLFWPSVDDFRSLIPFVPFVVVTVAIFVGLVGDDGAICPLPDGIVNFIALFSTSFCRRKIPPLIHAKLPASWCVIREIARKPSHFLSHSRYSWRVSMLISINFQLHRDNSLFQFSVIHIW